MTTHDLDGNRTLVREYHRTIAEQRFDRLAAFYAPDFTVDVGRMDGSGSTAGGVAEVVALSTAVFGAFSETSIEEHECVAEGDWVLCRIVFTGVHTGELLGIPPTENEVAVQIHQSYRVRDGAFVEVHSTADYTGLLGQLGVELPVG